jgi:hypothetical protein
MNRVLTGAIVLAVLAVPPLRGHEVRTVGNLSGGRPQERFACEETVYVLVEWKPRPGADGRLKAEWIGPSGATEETTSVPVRSGDRNTYLWLKLPRTGAFRRVWGSGDEDRWSGRWTVRLRLDQWNIGSRTFEVAC